MFLSANNEFLCSQSTNSLSCKERIILLGENEFLCWARTNSFAWRDLLVLFGQKELFGKKNFLRLETTNFRVWRERMVLFGKKDFTCRNHSFTSSGCCECESFSKKKGRKRTSMDHGYAQLPLPPGRRVCSGWMAEAAERNMTH